ncbi:MAG: POTRA domain-containing protein, partial [Nitrospiraceae bacterium]
MPKVSWQVAGTISQAIVLLMYLMITFLPLSSFGEQPITPNMAVIQGFTFTGNRVIREDELAEVVEEYTGKALDLAILEEAASQVTELYKRKGYTLASAYVPQQEIRYGIVEIAVLEGTLGDLLISGNQFYSTDFIRKHFAPVMEERTIRNISLERSLLLLNEYPDLKVSATLEPGISTGATDLRAKVEDTRPLHVSFDYNNYGFNTISRNRFGGGVEIGNVLFSGATLNVNGIVGEHPDQLLFQTLAYTVPLGVHGSKLVLSGSNGRFDVGADAPT